MSINQNDLNSVLVGWNEKETREGWNRAKNPRFAVTRRGKKISFWLDKNGDEIWTCQHNHTMPAGCGSCPEGENRKYRLAAEIFQATCFLDDVDENDPDKDRHRRENKYAWDKMKEAKGSLCCCLPEWRGIAQSPQEGTEKRITFVPLSHPYCSNYAGCRTEFIGGILSFDSFLCMHCARDGKILTDCITNVNLNFLCKNSCGSFLHPSQDVLAVIDKDIAQNNPDAWKWLCWNTVVSTPEEQIKTRQCLKINDGGAGFCADCYSTRLGGSDWGTFIA